MSTTNILTLCPSFNLKAFERQQLYKIWPYMGLLIISPCLYIPIFCSSNLSCSNVRYNIDVRMYGSFGPLFLLMKSTNSSQCLPSLYEVWSCLGARTISLPFNNQWIITGNVVFGNSRRLLLTFLPVCSPKSVAGHLLPCLPFFLTSRISLANFFKNTSTYSWQVHSALLKMTNSSKVSNLTTKSATAISEGRGPTWKCFNRFCPRIMDRCYFWRNSCHPYLLPLVECIKVGLPHSFGKLLQGELHFLHTDWGFAFSTAQVQRIVALISCIIFVVGHLRQWGLVCNTCDIWFPRLRWWLESLRRENYGVFHRCAGRRLRWKIRAGRFWLIDWMISRQSWRHSWYTRRWRPLSGELQKGEHLRPAITTLVQVISMPWWPIAWIFLACTAARLWTVCHGEWRLVIKLQKTWKWLLRRRVTIPLRWMLLIGVCPILTVFASGMLWTFIWWFWIVVTALLQAKKATRWSHIHCFGWRSFGRHALSNKDRVELL